MVLTKQKMLRKLKRWVFDATAKHMCANEYDEILGQTNYEIYQGEGSLRWDSRNKTIYIPSGFAREHLGLTIAFSEEAPHVFQHFLTDGYYGSTIETDKIDMNKELGNINKKIAFEEGLAHTVSERVIGDYFENPLFNHGLVITDKGKKEARKTARQLTEKSAFYPDKLSVGGRFYTLGIFSFSYMFNAPLGYFCMREWSDEEIGSIAFKKGAHLDEKLPWNRELNKAESELLESLGSYLVKTAGEFRKYAESNPEEVREIFSSELKQLFSSA